ncbi:hypothetical protein F5Y05DRAFT_191768 [Hypoxylon sp. FL0543]|nr:hypothetical protein F5Y05DRAFT_191768 [Hypoxylon sp. FL0543]
MPDARYTSPSGTPHLRSRSRSRRNGSSENSGSQRQRGPSPAHSDSGKDVLKTSLAFLGVVGAASIAASKYWPKGILYGDKESWAHEAKEEVKHIVNGNGSNNSEDRRKPRGPRRENRDSRRRPPPRVDIRDEVLVRRPDGRCTHAYVDTGWLRCSEDGGSDRGRRRVIDRRDGRRLSDSHHRPREPGGF